MTPTQRNLRKSKDVEVATKSRNLAKKKDAHFLLWKTFRAAAKLINKKRADWERNISSALIWEYPSSDNKDANKQEGDRTIIDAVCHGVWNASCRVVYARYTKAPKCECSAHVQMANYVDIWLSSHT